MKFHTAESQPGAQKQEGERLYKLNTETFCVEAEPVDCKKYSACAETANFGALSLALVNTTGAVLSRQSDESMDPACKRYNLVYAIEGELLISHHLGTSELKTGDFILMDNSRPRKMLVKSQVSLLVVTIPCEVLKRYFPVPDVYVGLTMQAALKIGCREEYAFAPLLQMWEKLESGSLHEFAPTLSEIFLNQVAGIYTSQFHRHSTTAMRRIAEVKQAVEVQLCNPDLSVEVIADELGVTARYLRGLFHGMEKISHHILRRRLEECANQLNNPVCQHNSISSIAHRYGFASAAHFSRAFRNKFGHSPRDFRKKTHKVFRNN